MIGRAVMFAEQLKPLPSERARLRAGLPVLDVLYRELVRAATPPNPQFERERIIAYAPNPRELVFLLGLLSEGENETALLLDLIDVTLADDPQSDVAQLVDEAWYYLRTSIDASWQLDDKPPSASAALAYLVTLLGERLDHVRADPPAPGLAERDEPGRAALLRALRNELT